jgi:hypothetical protein
VVVAKFLASLLFCILMPLVVPGPIAEEHLEIHRSLERLARGVESSAGLPGPSGTFSTHISGRRTSS